jgi:hypothetical protein
MMEKVYSRIILDYTMSTGQRRDERGIRDVDKLDLRSGLECGAHNLLRMEKKRVYLRITRVRKLVAKKKKVVNYA